jgi:hypothetical protein
MELGVIVREVDDGTDRHGQHTRHELLIVLIHPHAARAELVEGLARRRLEIGDTAAPIDGLVGAAREIADRRSAGVGRECDGKEQTPVHRARLTHRRGAPPDQGGAAEDGEDTQDGHRR